MIDLEKLERLAKAATPGPWFVTCNCTGKTFYTIKNDRVYIGETLGVYNGEANAAYIVAACNAVPELIAENRALQERVRELEAENRTLGERLCEADKDVQDTIDAMVARSKLLKGELEEAFCYLKKRVRVLEAENADLKNQLRDALERN